MRDRGCGYTRCPLPLFSSRFSPRVGGFFITCCTAVCRQLKKTKVFFYCLLGSYDETGCRWRRLFGAGAIRSVLDVWTQAAAGLDLLSNLTATFMQGTEMLSSGLNFAALLFFIKKKGTQEIPLRILPRAVVEGRKVGQGELLQDSSSGQLFWDKGVI